MTDQKNALYDCIIVGAGYSGLAAAKQLKDSRSGLHILVLEARDRIGGRTKTIHQENGSYWDVGGSFLGLGQDRMYALAKEYGVKTYSAGQKGKQTFYSRGKAKQYSGVIPPMRLWEVVDAGVVMWKLERLVASVDVEAPWKHPKAKIWDSMTAEEWTRKHCKTEIGRKTMEMAWGAIFGKPGKEISFLHVLVVFKSLGSVDTALRSENGLQQDVMKGGGTAIAEKIREDIGGDETVILDAPVMSVDVSGEGSSCVVSTAKGKYQTKRVIFAVPPQFAAKVDFTPPLPDGKRRLLEAMELGAYSKVYATYDKPFWRDRGLRGECTNLDGYVSLVFDTTSPEEGSDARLMGFVTGAKSRLFAKLSEGERERHTLDAFAKMLGEEALQPKEFFYHSMLHEEWSAGCPLASPLPGVWTTCGEWIHKSVGPIHWAGTETATEFLGYMEGAVRAGQRAAKEVIAALDSVSRA